MSNLNSEPNRSQDNSETFLHSSIENSQKLDGGRDLHPAIQQLFALGYGKGDRVTGRNISITGRNNDWAATLTEDSIELQEYSWKTGSIELDGEYHKDGLAWLNKENQLGKQIYFNVNGGRTNKEVSRIFAVFFEHDSGTHAEQMSQVVNFPIPASVAVRTRKSTHTYYTVYGDDIEDIEGWVKLQEKIAYTMGSDPAVKDRPRLMRLAGFDHIKDGHENVLCTLEICDGDNSYTFAEIEQAIAAYATKKGVKPFTEERFLAYQFVNNRLNQKKDGRDYRHPRFNPDLFRTCEESEIAELIQRSKDWARLCDKKRKGEDVDPESAWTDELKTVHARVKKEYDINLIPSLSQGGDLLTVKWAKAYTEGFEENGRAGWHTCKCPAHGGNSDDSLHINVVTGAVKCHGGCDSRDVEVCLRQMAKDAGDENWNVELYKDQAAAKQTSEEWYRAKVEAEQTNLNTLTIKPEYTHIICEGRYSKEILQSLPAQYILVLKGPTGAGKSWAIDQLINNESDRVSNVLSVTPTVALSYTSANRFGLDTREDVEAKTFNGVGSARRLSIVYPSLWKIGVRQYNSDDFVILDETRQGLEFLLNSDLCDKHGRRPVNSSALVKALKGSGRIILSDAYISNVELEYINTLRPDLPVVVIEIPITPIEREVWVMPKQAFLDDKLKELVVVTNKRVDVATDSQELGEAIDREFTVLGKKVLRVDAKTKNEELQQKFLDNPNEYLAKNHVDVLIWSPTLGSGFDMTEGNFDAMVAYNTHQTPTDFMQLIGRDRQRQPLYYFCSADKNTDGGSVFASEQEESITRCATDLREMAGLVANPTTNLQTQLEELTRMLAGTSENLNLKTVAKQKARKAYSTQQRAEKVKTQMQKDGLAVYEVADEDLEGINNEVSKALKEHKAEIKKEWAEKVIAAELVDDAKGKQLLEKNDLTEKERAEADRYRMESRYPGFLTDLIIASSDAAEEFYLSYIKDKGRWLKTVWNRYAYENREKLKDRDIARMCERVKSFCEFGEESLNDLKKIKAPFYRFVESIGLFQLFRDGGRTRFTLRDVAAWVYKITDESKLDELMSYVGAEDNKRVKPFIRANFIKSLDKKYIDGLSDYFDFTLPTTGGGLRLLVRTINSKILAKFGYELKEREATNPKRHYIFSDSDSAAQKIYRPKLELILKKEADKKSADLGHRPPQT